jgi:hypothetical protein
MQKLVRMLELVKKINRKGDLFIKKNGIKDFHKFAADILTDSHLEDQFNYQEVVEHAFSSRHGQNFKNLEFSDLPVTIAQGENCFIDLYFWRRRPTVIHNHHFTGAFMCLLGQNIDLEFTFQKTKKLGRFHDLGELELKHTRRMGPGAVAGIPFMDKFIHQNHHQADLTVNLCFRTPQFPGKNLSNYLFSGLRFEKNPDLLGRVGRLHRFLNMGDFDYKKVKINADDAINFLIQSFDTRSENPRLLKLQKMLNKNLKSELGVDISALMNAHEAKFDKMLEGYE